MIQTGQLTVGRTAVHHPKGNDLGRSHGEQADRLSRHLPEQTGPLGALLLVFKLTSILGIATCLTYTGHPVLIVLISVALWAQGAITLQNTHHRSTHHPAHLPFQAGGYCGNGDQKEIICNAQQMREMIYFFCVCRQVHEPKSNEAHPQTKQFPGCL